MRGLPELDAKSVSLVPFREAWASDYARWLADPYIQSMAGETTESVEQVLERHRDWTESDHFVEYIIVDKASGLPIGDVSLNASQLPPRFGILIGEPTFRGTGCSADAAARLLAYALERGWTRIVAEVYDHNERSLRFHEKLGFCLREHDAAGHQWILEIAL